MDYGELRQQARTGDLVFFARLKPLRIRHWAQLLGLLSNCMIAYSQRARNSRLDGFWAFIHVGMIVRNAEHDELLLAEYTAGQHGPGLNRLSARVASYSAPVVYAPLRRDLLIDHALVAGWLEAHRVDRYNYMGLAFPTASALFGWSRPGRMFCSEAVVSALQWCGALPSRRRDWSDSIDELVEAPVCPWHYSPDEVASLREIIAWDSASVITVGRTAASVSPVGPASVPATGDLHVP